VRLRNLGKVKDIPHIIASGTKADAAAEVRKRQPKFTKKLSSVLSLLTPEAIAAYFGTSEHNAI
jgi:hypothetical protein